MSEVIEGVEVVDIDDMNAWKLYLECVRIVFKVNDFKAQIFQFVELAGEELLETHNPDAVSVFKQIQFEGEAKNAEPLIASQREVVDKLKNGLVQMKDKLSELKTKRDQLVARQKAAEAQAQVSDAVASINVLDPTSELSRFEDKVRRTEAMAQGKAEVATSSLDSQFAELETDSSQAEIEARLAALKQQH